MEFTGDKSIKICLLLKPAPVSEIVAVKVLSFLPNAFLVPHCFAIKLSIDPACESTIIFVDNSRLAIFPALSSISNYNVGEVVFNKSNVISNSHKQFPSQLLGVQLFETSMLD